MRKPVILAIACLVALHLHAQYTVQTIPNQKLIDNSYVSNPDNILDDGTVSQINAMLGSLESTSTAQVAVVVVRSIGEEDIFDFAEELFNTWGIGRNNDNGLLILLVEDQRTVRFHTGDGMEGVLPDATCKRIQREYMVPEFKNGNYSAGVLAGVQEVQRILTDRDYREELVAPDDVALDDYWSFVLGIMLFFVPLTLIVFGIKAMSRRFFDSKKPDPTQYPEMRFKRWTWLITFFVVPVLIFVYFGLTTEDSVAAILTFYSYFLLTALYKLIRMQSVIRRFGEKRDYYQIVQFLKSTAWYWFFAALIFPLPFALYFFYHLLRKSIYRNHPRQCTHCQGTMRKLNEKDDDAFLTENKRMEESLRSVDYDVWQCSSCQATEEWSYAGSSTKYKACPHCDTKAWYLVGRKTITSATYSSSGTGEETYSCKFCGKSKKEKYTIARLQRSTSSSSGGSSLSGGSSSGGGSWGGGRSSGGGASSSW